MKHCAAEIFQPINHVLQAKIKCVCLAKLNAHCTLNNTFCFIQIYYVQYSCLFIELVELCVKKNCCAPFN